MAGETGPVPAPVLPRVDSSGILRKLAKAADAATHLRETHKAKQAALKGTETFDAAKTRLRNEDEQAKFGKNTLKKFDQLTGQLARDGKGVGEAELKPLAFAQLNAKEQAFIVEKMTTELGENAPDYVVKYNDARAEAEGERVYSGMNPKDKKAHLDRLMVGNLGDAGKLPDYAKPLYEEIQTKARVRESDKRNLGELIGRDANLSPEEALRAAELGLELRPQDVEDVVIHLTTLNAEERQQLIEEEPLLKGYEDVMKAVAEKGKEFHDADLTSESVSENMEAQKGFVEQTVGQYLETKQKLAEAEANASGELTPERTAQIMLDHELQVPLDKLLGVQTDIGDKVDAAVAGEVIAQEIAKNNPELEGTAALRVMEAKKSALLSEVDAGLNKTEKNWGTADTEKDGGTKTGLEAEYAVGPEARLKELANVQTVEEALQTVDSAIFSPDTVEAVALVMTGDVDVARSLGEYWAKAKQYSEQLSDPSLRAEVEDKILGPQKEQLKAAIAVVIERGGTPFTEEGLQLLKKGVVLDGKDVPVVRDGSGKIIKILDQLPAETHARWEQDGVNKFGDPRMIRREYVAKDLVYGVQPGSTEEAFAMMESLMSNLSIESGAGGSEKAKMYIAESNVMSVRMQQELITQQIEGSDSVSEQRELGNKLERLNHLSAVLEKTQSLVAAESGYHSLQALKNLITNGELGDIAAYSSVEEFTKTIEGNEHLTDEQKQSLKLLFGEKTNAFSYEVAGVRLYTEVSVREVERVFDRAHLIASAKEVSFEEYDKAVKLKESGNRFIINNKIRFVQSAIGEGETLAGLEEVMNKTDDEYSQAEQQLAGHYNRRAEMQNKLAAMEKRVGEIVQENSAQRQVAEATIPDLTKAYGKLHRDAVNLDKELKQAIRQRAKIEKKLGEIKVSIKTASAVETIKRGIREADAAVRKAERALKQKQFEESQAKRSLEDERGRKKSADKSNNTELRKTVAEQKKILLKDLREVDELIAGFEDIDPQTGKNKIQSLKEARDSAKNDHDRLDAIQKGDRMERWDEEEFVNEVISKKTNENLERMRRGLLATIDITGEWPEGFMPEMKEKMQGGLPKSVAEKRKVLDEEAVKVAKADFEGPAATMKALLEQYQLGEVADDQLKDQLAKAIEAQGDTSKQSVDAIVESVLAIWREAGFVDDEGAEEIVGRLLRREAYNIAPPRLFEEIEKEDFLPPRAEEQVSTDLPDWLKNLGTPDDNEAQA